MTIPICPRCHGQLFRDLDNEVSCLQCGYSPDVLDPLPLIRERQSYQSSGRPSMRESKQRYREERR